MRRDDDLLRDLLIEAEQSDDRLILAYPDLNPADEVRGYHMELLADAGFMVEEGSGAYRLTNLGHDYLAAVRNDTVWNQTKEAIAPMKGATLGVIKDIAVAYFKAEIRKTTGLDI